MGLVATNTGKSMKPAPAGTHAAICVQVIDIGTQHSEFYDKDTHKIVMGFELPTEQNPDDGLKPFLVWKRYTLSLNKKAALRQHLEAWRGRSFTDEELRGFHLKNVLGKQCYLNLVHSEPNDGVIYANIAAIMACPKDCPKHEQTHPTILFDIDEWDDAVFNTFGDKLKKTILSSAEAIAKFPGSAATVAVKTNGESQVDDDDGLPPF